LEKRNDEWKPKSKWGKYRRGKFSFHIDSTRKYKTKTRELRIARASRKCPRGRTTKRMIRI